VKPDIVVNLHNILSYFDGGFHFIQSTLRNLLLVAVIDSYKP